MVTICQKCGDIGFANAFVYCVKCLDFAVHRYCLDKLPGNFDEFVYWFCEDCKPEVAKQCPLEKPSPGPSKKRYHASSKDDQVTGSKIKLKKKKVPCLVAETKEQRRQSRPSEQPHEAHEMLDFERPHLPDDCSILKIKLKKSDTMLKIKLKKKSGSTCPVAATELQRHQSSPTQQRLESHTKPDLKECGQLVGDRHLKIKLKKNEKGITCSVAGTEEQRHQTSSSQKSCEGHRKLEWTKRARSVREKRKGITSKLAEIELASDFSLLKIKPSVADTKEQKSQSSQPRHSYGTHRELEEGSRLDKEVGCVRIDASQTAPGHFSNASEHNYHLHAQPLIDPIWMGSFNICNKKYGIFAGVVAHLSSKACPKVCEEASLLPTLLCAEMLPKFDVWPKSFERAEPSDDNIALYFFPQNKTYKIVFDSLVGNMMRGELAMRVMVKNAELLVFTSNKLPLQYWKFQGKYYLWGVFKGKQASSTHQVNYDLMAQNSNNECDVHSNSANALGMAEREPVKTKTWDARSRLSRSLSLSSLNKSDSNR